jgi:hypothetical protein
MSELVELSDAIADRGGAGCYVRVEDGDHPRGGRAFRAVLYGKNAQTGWGDSPIEAVRALASTFIPPVTIP